MTTPTTEYAPGLAQLTAINEESATSRPPIATASRRRVYWCLRIGAGMCFIGHGAFGLITKAAWLPYFALVGISSDTAFTLMPLIGMLDISVGIAVLVSPRPFILLYMAAWALWTALLRPLVGETPFELVERAGNYGVPFALLCLVGWPRTLESWFAVQRAEAATGNIGAAGRVLLWTTTLLLFGHGALEAITAKAIFATHFASIGLPPSAVAIAGWGEMIIALAVMVRPKPRLLVAIAVWKVLTEALFPLSGTPIWEFVERAGSYAAPFALALLVTSPRGATLPRRSSHETRE